MKLRGILAAFVLFFLIGTAHGGNVYAENSSKEDLEQLATEALMVQHDFSEGLYTEEEVQKAMQPFFTSSFIELFIRNAMVEEDGMYYVPGTDFPVQFIPPFETGTKLEECSGEEESYICLYGYFPSYHEGPVGYDAHYESVIATVEDGKWKIDGVDYEYVPEKTEAKTMGAMAEPVNKYMYTAFSQNAKQSSFFDSLNSVFSLLFNLNI